MNKAESLFTASYDLWGIWNCICLSWVTSYSLRAWVRASVGFLGVEELWAFNFKGGGILPFSFEWDGFVFEELSFKKYFLC